MHTVTKETFKAKVQELAERFSDNESFYKSSKYKEDQLRQEFINPFFKALGWDMDNEQGFAPQYREVIHEDRIEVEGKPKAPDYAFKVGSDRKFFVEAKASFVRVFSEIDPAFQLRRYAWSGQLPVSILTDFEEFSIYDTTIEPKHTDKASVARIKYIHYKEYIDEADYLWDTFSKEAVWKGSFDKFAKREKKGSQLVDKSFLKEIELWRDIVAKDIAKNNELNVYDLNFVVQKFIDRLIFLRIAEDRGIETYETLKSATKGSKIYTEILKIFKRAEQKYNSSLFNFEEDKLSTEIEISNKALEKILNNLYYPKSPYEFSVIGVEILGSIYEQFLGKVVRLTQSGNAIIEEKPEVKKAGGVYYTPQYIVDYIVENTVGELVKAKTPKDVAKLKIVDPACGSGSFLIGAYNYLLNWYHQYYINHDVEKHLKAKKIFKDGEGNYFLSTQEKKDILINNIHGVDIDPQAVEVTKLSLALKMLEGENSETINTQYKLFVDRILPDLSSNIKCGNSLIGNDYYSNKQISLLDDEELRKVNAFDWDKEYPLVFRYGGFDAVIGNPPYIRNTSLDEKQKEYFSEKYDTAEGQYDIYILFNELAERLLKISGKLGFIQPNKFLGSEYGFKLLLLFKNKFTLDHIWNVSLERVFNNASVYPYVFIMTKENKRVQAHKSNIHMFDLGDESCFEGFGNQYKLYHTKLKNITKNTEPLGLHIRYIQRGVPNSKIDKNAKGKYRAFKSKDLSFPYFNDHPRSVIDYKNSQHGQEKQKEFENEMVLLPRTVLKLRASLKPKDIHVLDRIYYIVRKDNDFSNELLLAILNSEIMDEFYELYFGSTKVGGGYYDLKGSQIKNLPVPKNLDRYLVKEIERLVNKYISMRKVARDSKTTRTQAIQIEKSLNSLHEKIDLLVDKLYNQTNDNNEGRSDIQES